MKIAEKSFTADGIDFPAGSFVIAGAPGADAKAAVEKFGLTGAAISQLAERADARRRRAAHRDLLVVEQHAGPRLVPLSRSTSSTSRTI